MIRTMFCLLLAVGVLAGCATAGAPRPAADDYETAEEFEKALIEYRALEEDARLENEQMRSLIEGFLERRIRRAHEQGYELVELDPETVFWIETGCEALAIATTQGRSLPPGTPETISAACATIGATAGDDVSEEAPASMLAPAQSPIPPRPSSMLGADADAAPSLWRRLPDPSESGQLDLSGHDLGGAEPATGGDGPNDAGGGGASPPAD